MNTIGAQMRYSKRYTDLLLATAGQTRELDSRTIEDLGIPGETLMEIAGLGAADYISSSISQKKPILLVCGKGNNAGDAFVCARALLNYGFDITIFPVFGTNGMSDDATRNLNRLKMIGQELLSEIIIWDQWFDPAPYGLIVDAIFGTGLRSEVKTPVSDIIDKINLSGKPVYSLDIPSGLHCDSGNILGTSVQADVTLQFGLRKLGCYLGKGKKCAGNREFISLPFPNSYKKYISVRLLDESWDPLDILNPVNNRNRPPGFSDYKKEQSPITKIVEAESPLHKYNNGVVHVIGGSAGITGAPLYTARAAWSLGLGSVTLIHPSAWSAAFAAQAPEIIKKPIGSDDTYCFNEENADDVLAFMQVKPGITVIGPGAGKDDQTARFMRRIIEGSEGPVIIDADGLHCIVDHEEIISRKKHPEQVILTPHSGELSGLAKSKFGNDYERLQQTINIAERLGCTILSKGNPGLVHSPFIPVTLVTGYDTSLFARAGFGDVLAGHIAAFYSRTEDANLACEAGMLYGIRKLTALLSENIRFPEPSDLL